LTTSGRWHADSEAEPVTGLKPGTSEEHFSPIDDAEEHRGWNAHPEGGEIIDGGVPEMANSSLCPDSPRLRTDRKSPQEYG
jgi:hypothetical protein